MTIRRHLLSSVYLLSIFFVVPLLHLYNLPGTSVNFMNIGLGMILAICVYSRFFIPRLTIDSAYIPLLIYIPLQTIYACFTYNIDTHALILSVGQYLSFFLLLIFFNVELFNVSRAKKFLFTIATLSCIYIVIQFIVAKLFGIYMGAGLPFLEVSSDAIANYTDAVVKYDMGYRPRSFFSEPAMFSTYILLALTISLHDIFLLNKKRFSKYAQVSLYIIGILISQSSLGIVTLFFLFLCYILYFGAHSKIKITFSRVLFLLGIIAGIVVLTQSSIIQDQVMRLFYSDLSNEPRLKFFYEWDTSSFSGTEILLGHDFKLLTYNGEFLPSFFRQFYCFGLIGEVLLIILLIKVFLRLTLPQKFIFIVFFVQMIGSELLHGGNFLLYFSWLLPLKENRDNVVNMRGKNIC